MGVQYTCANCDREIEEGEFIAVIGRAPASGLSTPVGRADKLFDDIGWTYCADCLRSIGADQLLAQVDQTA